MIFGPADFRKELPLSWVCIFYDGPRPSNDIRILMQKDYQRVVLKDRYPGYHYLFLPRQNDYLDSGTKRLAQRQNIIARCIPLESEKYIAIAAAQDDEEVTLNSFNEFMDFLIDNNAHRCAQLGYNPNLSIAEILRKYFPQESRKSAREIRESLTNIFASSEFLSVSYAKNIELKIEPNLKGIAHTPYENVRRRNDEGDWIVNMYVDGTRYEIALKGLLFRKAMLFYMLLHPNSEFSGNTFNAGTEGEAELRRIVETMYAENPLDNFKYEITTMFNTHIRGENGHNFSRNMRKIGTVINNDGNLFVELPLSWVMRTTCEGLAAKWIFSSPEDVVIDTSDFQKAMLKKK